MSSETWALVGVVVGALLGGGAQIVADWLRNRHERRSVARAERREAYGEFMATTQSIITLVVFGRPAGSPEAVAKVIGTEVQVQTDRLAIAESRVYLLGQQDTYEAARKATLAVMAYAVRFGSEDEVAAAYEAASEAVGNFALLAKRDLT